MFHSFAFIASKEFIVDNDCKIIDDIIYELKIFNKKDSKITLVSLTFFAEVYEKLWRKSKVTTTVQYLFCVINEFGKTHNLKTVKLYLVVDAQQNSKSDTCGYL